MRIAGNVSKTMIMRIDILSPLETKLVQKRIATVSNHPEHHHVNQKLHSNGMNGCNDVRIV